MNPWPARLVSVLLVALALVLCEPERAAADTQQSGIVSDAETAVTPACGTATDDDLGLPKSKTNLAAAVSTDAVGIALGDRTLAPGVPPLPLAAPRQISLEVLVPRAPPLA